VLGGLAIERDLHVGQGEWSSGAAAGEPAGDWNIFVGSSRPLIGASPQIDEVANVEKARNRSGLRRLIGATRDRGRNGDAVGEAQLAARSRPVELSGKRDEDRSRIAFEAVVRRRRNQLAAPGSFRRAKVPYRPEGQKHRRRATDVDVDAGRIDPDRLRNRAGRRQKQKNGGQKKKTGSHGGHREIMSSAPSVRSVAIQPHENRCDCRYFSVPYFSVRHFLSALLILLKENEIDSAVERLQASQVVEAENEITRSRVAVGVSNEELPFDLSPS